MIDRWAHTQIYDKMMLDDTGHYVKYSDRLAEVTALQKEVEKLKWDRDGFMSALERVSFERDKYRVTVEKIAKQIKSDEEIDGILVSEYGNIQAGYDGIIDVAREALSTEPKEKDDE